MTVTWRVRALVEEDWEILRDLRLAALRDEPDAYGMTLEVAMANPEHRWRMMAREYNFHVAEVDGEAVAMASGGLNDQYPGTTWLYGMFVRPPWRGQGAGDAVVAAIADWARGEGSDALYLHVTETLSRPRAFYRRLGFVETGARHSMQRDPGLELLEMRKPLSPFTIEVVAPERLHDLRRRVLRGGRADAKVSDVRDAEPTSLHLAGVLDGIVVVSASFYPSTSPVDPDTPTWMLRYMATDPSVQGRGYGAAVLTEGERRVRELGAAQLWANGRDTALGFYRRLGWRTLVGSEHLSPETQLPHTVITKDL